MTVLDLGDRSARGRRSWRCEGNTDDTEYQSSHRTSHRERMSASLFYLWLGLHLHGLKAPIATASLSADRR
jgi:hypothetical protein